MNDWISVKDRLPKHESRVLCFAHNITWIKYFEQGESSYIFYDGDTHCYCPVGEISEVTHWMPLPKPPEVNNG